MTNELQLDATYTVRYFRESPKPPHAEGQKNYKQAAEAATPWIREEREIDIFDGSLPILHIALRGVKFVTFDQNHAHFLEHMKIKIALDRVWGEYYSKSLRLQEVK